MVSKVTPDTMLSASRLPAVMGISRYQTANDELELSINALKSIPREDISNEAMSWGNHIEPIILAQAAERLRLADLVTHHPEARYHASLPLCCSLDGTGDGVGQVITTDPEQGIYVIGADSIKLDGVGVLEAKLTAMDAEDVPPLWRGPIQLQAQMDIIQAKWGAVCTLYRGVQLRIFLFEPHQATVEAIAAATVDFQRRLDHWKATDEVDYYPPAEGERWPAHRGAFPAQPDPIVLDESAEMLARKIFQTKQEIKQLEDDIEEDEKALKKMIGTHELAIAGGYTIARPVKNFKAQPAKTVPAKEAYTIQQSTLTIKEKRA